MASYPATDAGPLQLIRFNEQTGDMEVVASGARRGTRRLAGRSSTRAALPHRAPAGGSARFRTVLPQPSTPPDRRFAGLRGRRAPAARGAHARGGHLGVRPRAHRQVLHTEPAARPQHGLPAVAQPPAVHQGAVDLVAAGPDGGARQAAVPRGGRGLGVLVGGGGGGVGVWEGAKVQASARGCARRAMERAAGVVQLVRAQAPNDCTWTGAVLALSLSLSLSLSLFLSHTHTNTHTHTQWQPPQVLLDSEGIDAYNQTARDGVQLLSLAVLLSSLFVFNQMGPIDEAAIDRLGLVTEVRVVDGRCGCGEEGGTQRGHVGHAARTCVFLQQGLVSHEDWGLRLLQRGLPRRLLTWNYVRPPRSVLGLRFLPLPRFPSTSGSARQRAAVSPPAPPGVPPRIPLL
jgi:hypothetical protein